MIKFKKNFFAFLSCFSQGSPVDDINFKHVFKYIFQNIFSEKNAQKTKNAKECNKIY